MNTLLTYIFADLIYVVLALNNKIKFPQNVILAKLRKFAPQNLSYFGRKTSENKINFFSQNNAFIQFLLLLNFTADVFQST